MIGVQVSPMRRSERKYLEYDASTEAGIDFRKRNWNVAERKQK